MERLLHRTNRQDRIKFFGWLSRRIELRRQRLDLGALTDHRLQDIGLSASEARAEAERPVWDVPATWRR
jgi:uncharacterized protein YjiS (DUF1127 family)